VGGSTTFAERRLLKPLLTIKQQNVQRTRSLRDIFNSDELPVILLNLSSLETSVNGAKTTNFVKIGNAQVGTVSGKMETILDVALGSTIFNV